MDTLDFDQIFANYQKEIIEDIQVNEMSLKDKVMLVPTIKHKWVARLMVHKDQLRKLNDAKKKLTKNLIAGSPIPLSRTTADQKFQNDPNITKLQDSIERLDIIILYLEKIEKLTSSLTFDCKNAIDMQKLETT